MDRGTWVKAGVLLLFLTCLFLLLRTDAAQELLTRDSLASLVESAGAWGPVAYVLLYALGTVLLVPGSLLTAVGAVLFGTALGTIYTIIGATLGAALAFGISRTLGRDLARRIAGETLQRYDLKLSRNGFAAIFYLRMAFVPFTPLNYAAGLTRIRFREYLAGTFLGIIPGTFILTFFVASIAQVVLAHGFFSAQAVDALFSVRVGIAVALFVASLFIPLIVRTRQRDGRFIR